MSLKILFYILIALFVWGTIINMILIALTLNRTRGIKKELDSIKSKTEDKLYLSTDILRRIERRCDAIDQRTKAHLNKKSNTNKKKSSNNVNVDAKKRQKRITDKQYKDIVGDAYKAKLL